MKETLNLSLIEMIRHRARSSPALLDLPAPLREAEALAAVLDELPLGLVDSESLAGDFGWEWVDSARQDTLMVEMQALAGELPGPPIDETARQMMARFYCNGDYSLAHTTADYPRVLGGGITGLLGEIKRHNRHAPEAKRIYLQAMTIALKAVIRWAERYADLAEAQAALATADDQRQRLLAMAAACRHVPAHPARSFHEALQSLWLLHAAVGISECCEWSLSLGAFDQYMLPTYRADLSKGVSPETLERLVVDLFRKLNRFGDPSCALNLGGLGPDGEDLYNPLSRLVLRVATRLHLPSPILAAHIHEDIPQDVFDALLDPALVEMGQPTFYGELACRETLVRRGVPAEEVHGWVANSCMAPMMPGEEIGDLWGGIANVLLPLELATHGGQPYRYDQPLAMAKTQPQGYDTFAQLWETFSSYLDELVAWCVDQNRVQALRIGEGEPNPYLSAITQGCIVTGQDRALGGARYRTTTIEAFGLVNVADALLAIRQLVFEQGRYALEELVKAALADFVGFDAVRAALCQAPKYGNGDPQADEMARDLAALFATTVKAYSDEWIQYVPSFHTLHRHIAGGQVCAASLDGRLAGAPLAKNMGTSPGRALHGHTALMASATAIDQYDFAGGQALDISLDLKLLGNPTDREKVQALLQTYFRLGGLQVQVNGVSADTLRAAMAQPEAYGDLLVRIAGYSARFVTLSPVVQAEMVERFEAGM